MPSDRRFIALHDDVEAQGGKLLNGTCKPKTLVYKKGEDHVTTDEGGKIQLTGCNRQRRFQIPDLMMAGEAVAPKITVACADDDLMYLWPRFASTEAEEDE
jgi:hypothetical protein